jgi:hypothetical protein
MNNLQQHHAPDSFESIRAILRETAQLQRENEQQMKENDRRLSEKLDRLEKAMDRSNQKIEGISRSNGEFCEEYFINALTENPVLLGQTFDHVLPNFKQAPPYVKIQDEYDLILHNGGIVALIEMKYKANINDVGKMFSKLHSYRENFPMFADYKVYLCLASFSFSEAVRERAEEEGIVLIQQQGDVIEVVTKNLRTF